MLSTRSVFRGLKRAQIASIIANGLVVHKIHGNVLYLYIQKNPAGAPGTSGTGELVPADLITMDEDVARWIRTHGSGTLDYPDGTIQTGIRLGFTEAEVSVPVGPHIVEISPKHDGASVRIISDENGVAMFSRYGLHFEPQSRPLNGQTIEEQTRGLHSMLGCSRLYIVVEYMKFHTSFPCEFQGGECVVLSLSADGKAFARSEIVAIVEKFNSRRSDSVFVSIKSYMIEVTEKETFETIYRNLPKMTPRERDLYQEGCIANYEDGKSVKYKSSSWLITFQTIKTKGFALHLEILKSIVFMSIESNQKLIGLLQDLFSIYDASMAAREKLSKKGKEESELKFIADIQPHLHEMLGYQFRFTPDKWQNKEKIIKAVLAQSLAEEHTKGLTQDESYLVKSMLVKTIVALTQTVSKDGTIAPAKKLMHCMGLHVARCWDLDPRIVAALIPGLCHTLEMTKTIVEERYPLGEFPGHHFQREMNYLDIIQPKSPKVWKNDVLKQISGIKLPKFIVIDIDGTVITDGQPTRLVEPLKNFFSGRGEEIGLIAVTGTHYTLDDISRITKLDVKHMIKCPNGMDPAEFKKFVAQIIKDRVLAWFDDSKYVCKAIVQEYPGVTCTDHVFFGESKKPGFVILLTGKIGSGKSFYSKKLSERIYAACGCRVSLLVADINDRMEKEGRDPEADSLNDRAVKIAMKGGIAILDFNAVGVEHLIKKLDSAGIVTIAINIELQGDLDTQIAQLVESISLREQNKATYSTFTSDTKSPDGKKSDLFTRLKGIHGKQSETPFPSHVEQFTVPGFQKIVNQGQKETHDEAVARVDQQQLSVSLKVCEFIRDYPLQCSSLIKTAVNITARVQFGDKTLDEVHVTMKYGADYTDVLKFLSLLGEQLRIEIDGVYSADFEGNHYEFCAVTVFDGKGTEIAFDSKQSEKRYLHITLQAEAKMAKHCNELTRRVREGDMIGITKHKHTVTVIGGVKLSLKTYGI